jgi:small GTP-binding protein
MTTVQIVDEDLRWISEIRSGFDQLSRSFETRLSNDPRAALEAMATKVPDLILLRVELTKMNGFSVCSRIKRDAQLAEVPVVIMSSNSTAETFEQHRMLRTRAESYFQISPSSTFGELLVALQQTEPIQKVLRQLSQGQQSQVPPEICIQGVPAVLAYLRSVSGGVRVHEAKLIVVGSGGVGKTSLCRRLCGEEFRALEVTTRGLEIRDPLVIRGYQTQGSVGIKLNVWDFGGQEIYHSTHRFFLSQRSLYLLVWDGRHETSVLQLEYWLRTIESFAGTSPVLLVQNKCDDRVDDINLKALRQVFPQIAGYFRVSCKDEALGPDSLESLQNAIVECATKLEHMGSLWAASWVAVREALQSDGRELMLISQYLQLCSHYGIDQEQALRLSRYLHDLGVVLHFSADPLLRSYLILKPHWGTGAVYRVLEALGARHRLGLMYESDARSIWRADHGYDETLHPMLFRLMGNFQLAFRVNGTDDYLIPELLPEENPSEFGIQPDDILFEYRYSFVPAGLIPQLLVRIHDRLVRTTDGLHWCWRSGLVIATEGATALIELQHAARLVSVRVRGAHALELLAIVRRDLEAVHEKYAKLTIRKEVRCLCEAECQYRWDYDVLKRAYERRIATLMCQENLRHVSVLKILGVVDPLRTSEAVVVKNYGGIHMGDKYENVVTGSNVATLVSGGHANAVGKLSVEQNGGANQSMLRAELAMVQKALIDSQDQLDELRSGLFEALGQFLRIARDIQVDNQQAKVIGEQLKNVFDDVAAQHFAEQLKPGVLPRTLEVSKALLSSPVLAALAKTLVG